MIECFDIYTCVYCIINIYQYDGWMGAGGRVLPAFFFVVDLHSRCNFFHSFFFSKFGLSGGISAVLTKLDFGKAHNDQANIMMNYMLLKRHKYFLFFFQMGTVFAEMSSLTALSWHIGTKKTF